MPTSTFNLRFGVWVASVGLLLAGAYLATLTAVGFSPSGFPPAAPYAVVISLISLLSGAGILILFATLHACAPEERKLLSLVALACATLFAGLTSINRFTHLAIVQPALNVGVVDGIEWFTPYGAYSIMTGMENLAWGFFLGLAVVFLAPVFAGGRIERLLSGTLVVNGSLCLISVFALPTGTTGLTYIGAMAWGPGFMVMCVLLIAFFRRKLTVTSAELPV